MKASQIPLELPFDAGNERDDLIVSPANAFAVEFIDSWPDWPGSLAVLCGPAGSGKSHMAGIWAKLAGAPVLRADELRDRGPEAAEAGCVAVDGLEPGGLPETALFHLVNAVRQAGGHCLLTCRVEPPALGVLLPDLASRLRAAQVVHVGAPDDALLAQVMVKLFADRQVAVDPGVVDYVVDRMERSLDAVGLLVAEMDRDALAQGRRVTRAIAAGALGRLAPA